MILLPPVFLVIGLVLMKNNTSASKYDLTPVQISPKLYLSPGNKESSAVPLLFENSTGATVDNMVKFLKDYNVDLNVGPLKDHLEKSSGKKPFWALGLEALGSPNSKNVS